MTWRWIPELRTIHGYCDEPAYADALAASIREAWQSRGSEPEQLLFSFHGIPLRYFQSGDPYHCYCHQTARRVAERLGRGPDRYVVAFQSRFGREEWLKPYTDVTVRAMARAGVASLDVVSPAFSADCLETLEELAGLNREFWEEAGGDPEGYRYLPCLNERPDHLELLAGLILRNLQGWVAPPGELGRGGGRRRRPKPPASVPKPSPRPASAPTPASAAARSERGPEAAGAVSSVAAGGAAQPRREVADGGEAGEGRGLAARSSARGWAPVATATAGVAAAAAICRSHRLSPTTSDRRGVAPSSSSRSRTICGWGLECASSAVRVAWKRPARPVAARSRSRPARPLPVATASR